MVSVFVKCIVLREVLVGRAGFYCLFVRLDIVCILGFNGVSEVLTVVHVYTAEVLCFKLV